MQHRYGFSCRSWLAALASVATITLSASAHAAFAIALNPSTGKTGAYNGTFDLGQAKRIALESCGSGCRIVASGKGTCAAVVESITTGGSIWAIGYGVFVLLAALCAVAVIRSPRGVDAATSAPPAPAPKKKEGAATADGGPDPWFWVAASAVPFMSPTAPTGRNC